MPTTATLTRIQAASWLRTMEQDHENRIISVTFRKRSTGELRTMVCRMGNTVQKGLTGKGPAYDPTLHNLVWVWDMQKDARRSIALEGIVSMRVAGTVYEVV